MRRFFTNKIMTAALLLGAAIAPAAHAQNRIDPCEVSFTTAAAAPVRKLAATDQFIRTELFFGTDRQDGPDVTEEQFQQFLKRVITPRFPDGLTVVTGLGQFLDSKGVIIQETSKLVILLYPVEDRQDKGEKIEKIRECYKQIFHQESVLRADDAKPVRVSF